MNLSAYIAAYRFFFIYRHFVYDIVCVLATVTALRIVDDGNREATYLLT